MYKNRNSVYEGHINMYPPQQQQMNRNPTTGTTDIKSESNNFLPYAVEDFETRDSVSSVYVSPTSASMVHSVPGHELQNLQETPPVPAEAQFPSFTSPPKSFEFTTHASPNMSHSKEDENDRPLSEFSEEALKFYKVYQTTINDALSFTPEIQLAWCEILLEYAFKPNFLSRYSINAKKLKRELTPQEREKNKATLLEHALKVLTKLLKMKYPPAIYLMGTLYSQQPYLDIDQEAIVPKNDVKALEYYRLAAKLGNADGCYRAGVSYEYGRGVPAGISRRDCLLKAVQYYETGVPLSREQTGSTCSMYKLGIFQLNGLIDEETGTVIVGQDVVSAVQWFEKATENENIASPQALFELAKIYEYDTLPPHIQQNLKSSHIPQDPVMALELYIKCACKCNYPLAQWKLGHCYEFGELNLPFSPAKSLAWYRLAATAKPRGNAMAMMSLSGWYLTGYPGILLPSDAEAFAWAARAAQAASGRLAKAEYGLGIFYEHGIGCDRDLNKALNHFNRAARLGHRRAIERLTIEQQ
ncbi:HHR180Cp [Eremothecium sinecaudum]|uniref:HHR180Cp n=1 Tax=Eremothecium sinecaudum TaxID=45286 RepID=A0A0X8HWS7_9SACH|nr:HHR180Cp [Eremothecium sinecaudum]AMD22949.1 HHR180Cp [Eremothecium sinecaudum]